MSRKLQERTQILPCLRRDNFDHHRQRSHPDDQTEWRQQRRPPTRAAPGGPAAVAERDNWYRDDWFSKQEQWQRDSGGGGGGGGGVGFVGTPERAGGGGGGLGRWGGQRREMMLHNGHLNRDEMMDDWRGCVIHFTAAIRGQKIF